MKTTKNSIERKLNKCFGKIFEKKLLHEILEAGTYKKFKKEDVLIDIDVKTIYIPLIINGIVKVVRENKNKNEILLYYLKKGDTCAISFSNCIKQSNNIFRGIAKKETECILIPVTNIEDWLLRYKSWRQYIIDSYHFRLIEMVNTINGLAFTNLEDRLNAYLSNQTKIMKKKKLAITHQQIANDLNSSRVVVSRLLKKMEHSGRIKMGRSKITIINL